MLRTAVLCALCVGAIVGAVPASVATSLPSFNPARSSSVSLRTDQTIRVNYADAHTELSGYRCSDDVRLGNYKARVAFSCFTHAPSQQFWSEMGNGVLGLGPKAQKRTDKDDHKLPVNPQTMRLYSLPTRFNCSILGLSRRILSPKPGSWDLKAAVAEHKQVPLLASFTSKNAVDSNAAGLPPKFAFMATNDAAELQVGCRESFARSERSVRGG